MKPELSIEHIAVAVEDLDRAIALFRSILGAVETGRETVQSEGVRVAFFRLGATRIELLEPTADDSPVGRFLRRRGPGLHHVAFEVRDLDAALRRCRAAGIQTVGEAPRPGAGGRRIAFLRPSSTGGVLIELSESPDDPA